MTVGPYGRSKYEAAARADGWTRTHPAGYFKRNGGAVFVRADGWADICSYAGIDADAYVRDNEIMIQGLYDERERHP